MEEGSSYVVCFETLDSSHQSSIDEVNENEKSKNCQEVRTLKTDDEFPIGEVATAAVVATTTTIIIAIFLCCLCPKVCKNKQSMTQDDQEKVVDNSKDENDNSTTPPECSPIKLRAQLKSSSSHDSSIDVIKRQRNRSPSPNNRSISMSPSMATTFEPELQSIMTEKDHEQESTVVPISSSSAGGPRDSKFRERYSTQIPKSSANGAHEIEKNTRFWKSCLTSSSGTNPDDSGDKPGPKSALKSEVIFYKNIFKKHT